MRNTIESMIASASEQELLTKKQIPEYMMRRMEKHEPEKRRTAEIDIEELQTAAKEDKIPYYAIMEDTERELIKKALSMAAGNKSRASEILGIPRKTLNYRIEKLKL